MNLVFDDPRMASGGDFNRARTGAFSTSTIEYRSICWTDDHGCGETDERAIVKE